MQSTSRILGINMTNGSLQQHQHQMTSSLGQQTILEQVKFVNKCSSYIDRKQQYQLADMFINNSKGTKTSKNNNIKKLRQCISNKFKKLMHLNTNNQLSGGGVRQSSQNPKPNTNDVSHNAENPIRLVNFNYHSSLATNFVHLPPIENNRLTNPTFCSQQQQTLTPQFVYKAPVPPPRRKSSHQLHQQIEIEKKSLLLQQHRLSTIPQSSRISLHSNGSSSSSTSSDSARDISFESDFIQLSSSSNRAPRIQNFISNGTTSTISNNLIETSTPIPIRGGGGTFIGQYQQQQQQPNNNIDNISSMPFLIDIEEDECSFCGECGGESNEINMALFMDQSTQVPVDSPVLIESTFNSSSLSNLSDDLIIVQTGSTETKKQQQQSSVAHFFSNTPMSHEKLMTRRPNESLFVGGGCSQQRLSMPRTTTATAATSATSAHYCWTNGASQFLF